MARVSLFFPGCGAANRFRTWRCWCCSAVWSAPVLPRTVSAARSVTGPHTSIEFGHRRHDASVRPQWARSAMPTTTPCARVSYQSSNASCSTAVGSRHRPKRAVRCSNSSRLLQSTPSSLVDRILLTDRLPASASRRGSHPRRTPACRAAIKVPSCSRPSRTSPLGGPKRGRFETAFCLV